MKRFKKKNRKREVLTIFVCLLPACKVVQLVLCSLSYLPVCEYIFIRAHVMINVYTVHIYIYIYIYIYTRCFQ